MSEELIKVVGENVPFQFGEPVSELFRDPKGYDPDPSLEIAARVALMLGMPLLLTGDPGCGKTSVATWLAWKLGLDKPLVCNVKSTTQGRDLLYEFDSLARFRDAYDRGPAVEDSKYLRLNALGLAIALSAEAQVPPSGAHVLARATLAKTRDVDGGAEVRFGKRHVVLIDELDKAPRDTPNDLLMEILEMQFHIPELDTWVNGSSAKRPVVVITSNSEKSLPEPFLRRCVFHHIQAPDPEARRKIIERRMHPFSKRAELFAQALGLFEQISSNLGRRPGTAELLAWMTILEARAQLQEKQGVAVQSLRLSGLVQGTFGALAKSREDLERAQALMPN